MNQNNGSSAVAGSGNRAARRASRKPSNAQTPFSHVKRSDVQNGIAKAYAAGEACGALEVENSIALRERIASDAKLFKSPEMRIAYRSGFVVSQMTLGGYTKTQATSRFDYLASKHAPSATSRKANAIKKAGGKTRRAGRKAKTTGKGTEVSAKQQSQRLLNVTRYAAALQAHPIPNKVLPQGWEAKSPNDIVEMIAAYIKEGIAGAILKLATGTTK